MKIGIFNGIKGICLWFSRIEDGNYREIFEKVVELEIKLGSDKVWLIDIKKEKGCFK